MSHRVTNIITTRHEHLVLPPAKKTPPKWIRKPLYALIDWLDKYNNRPTKDVFYTTHRLNLDPLDKSILEMYLDFRCFNDTPPVMLLLGRDLFGKINCMSHSPDRKELGNMDFQFLVNGKLTILGLDVKLIPDMEGMLIL